MLGWSIRRRVSNSRVMAGTEFARRSQPGYAWPVASALDGFLELECDDDLAGKLRAEVAAAGGTGYDHFEFNVFDIELFYAEGRVALAEAVPLGYDSVELPLSEFLAAIPDVPVGPRMPRRPRRVIITPPPST